MIIFNMQLVFNMPGILLNIKNIIWQNWKNKIFFLTIYIRVNNLITYFYSKFARSSELMLRENIILTFSRELLHE